MMHYLSGILQQTCKIPYTFFHLKSNGLLNIAYPQQKKVVIGFKL